MRIIPFPDDGHTVSEQAWQAEVEAALSGESEGAVADSWRELRGEVRALAPPMSREFEQRLKGELERRMARRRTRAQAATAPPRRQLLAQSTPRPPRHPPKRRSAAPWRKARWQQASRRTPV